MRERLRAIEEIVKRRLNVEKCNKRENHLITTKRLEVHRGSRVARVGRID